jgi:hypothetical protein
MKSGSDGRTQKEDKGDAEVAKGMPEEKFSVFLFSATSAKPLRLLRPAVRMGAAPE